MKSTILKLYLTCALLTFFLLFGSNAHAQGCTNKLTLTLKNIRGGLYSNQKVTFTSKTDGKSYSATSDANGQVSFDLPCEQTFEVAIANYTREMEISTTNRNGGFYTRNISYEPDMAEKDEFFAMDETQKKALDNAISKLPDTTDFKSWRMTRPHDIDNYTILTVKITDLKKKPLTDEQVTMTGEARNKSFRGKTSSSGTIVFYLPKGDKYSVNFIYNKLYATQEILYSKGTSQARLNLMYLGTPEMRRRHLAELERIRLEEERLKREHEEHLAWCKERGVSEEEGYKLKIKEAAEMVIKWTGGSQLQDTVVSAVLNRNKWSEKLIVCDLTGSMIPYAGQLSAWFQLNYKLEKNLQFVFFNDGDGKSDRDKRIGETGGIYYERATSLDNLMAMMGKVSSRGDGGDCAENNMEALIKGVEMAGPYKELVMIVDNNAPVKDIALLKNFNRPVHVILCGATRGFVLEHYLRIAWLTQGSIHTIEEDITKIASMSEGQTITVQGKEYKIMGGQFVQLSKT